MHKPGSECFAANSYCYKVLDEQHPQFTYLSDLWAAGITILWSVFVFFALSVFFALRRRSFWQTIMACTRQMLFWGCEVNLRHSSLLTHRFFPFHLLKDDKHDYSKLKTAFPKEKFKQVVQKVLRNNYSASSDTQAVKQFNYLCDIFEFMYAKKHLKRPGFLLFARL